MDADKPVMKEIVRYFEQGLEGEPLDTRESEYSHLFIKADRAASALPQDTHSSGTA